MYYSTAPFSDLAATQASASGTRLSDTSYQFTATFTAPSTPGTAYYQVAAQVFDINMAGAPSRAGWFIDPCTARSESLREVIVPAITTGVQVSLTSPTATNEFIVRVDGAGASQVSRVTGSSMTSASLTLGVGAGGPYRVRAVALDPRTGGTFPAMSASGMATNVFVTAGVLTPVELFLAAPTVEITAPASVSAGTDVTISWTYTDPGAALDRLSLDGRVFYSTAPFADLAATQASASGTRLSETSYQFTATFTAPSTPGTVYYQVAAQVFDINMAGAPSRAGWFIDPCSARSESLRALVLQ